MRQLLLAMAATTLILWPAQAFPCTDIAGAHRHPGAEAKAWGIGVGVRVQRGLRFFLDLGRQPEPPAPLVAQAFLPPVVVAAGYSAPPLMVAQGQPAAPVVVAPVVVPPVIVAPVVVQSQAAEVRAPHEEEEPPRPARVAFKWAPAGWSSQALPLDGNWAAVRETRNLGLEFRLSRRWALRSDLQYGSAGNLWDVAGLKLALFPDSALRPYGSVSLAGHLTDARLPGQGFGPRVNLGLAGALGLDLHFGRHFFLEAEVRYRRLRAECCGEVPQFSGLAGGGVAF